MNDVQERIWKALMPEAAQQGSRIRRDGTRFVHYTSAEAGVAILRSGRMLLRNSTLMNDFSEVQHGMHCLAHAYQSSAGEKLRSLMQSVQSDLPDVFQSNFDDLFLDLRSETYLVSVSEHGDPVLGDEFEDSFGRLSMWRAYAARNGVAFVFRNTPFVTESNALNAFTNPVVYATPESYIPHFEKIVDGLEEVLELIAPAGGAYLHELLFDSFRFVTQSTKHPAFREEREWRVIYTPTLLERAGEMTDKQTKRVPSEIMTIRGVPQRVHALPFRDYPDDGFTGATIPELLERVLVGPSPDAYAIAQAFVAELFSAGVEDAQDKVSITNVPLRT